MTVVYYIVAACVETDTHMLKRVCDPNGNAKYRGILNAMDIQF